jgi:shikimate kinase
MNKNIVLIGMPGCGKTTIGRELAKRLEFGFADADEEVIKQAGMSINEIFSLQGEKAFRDLESQVIERLSRLQKYVISTGGGVILRDENMRLLKERGFIIFIDRPIEKILSDIETRSRPLLEKKDSLKKLYAERYELYNKYCNKRVLNTGELPVVVNAINNMTKEVQ